MKRIDILGMSADEMEDVLAAEGFPPFRAKQLHSWAHGRGVADLSKMSNLPGPLRAFLAERADLAPCVIASERVSPADSTRKLLVSLGDGLSVETVLMKEGAKSTVCVSTQVGCALECAFCATGRMGFVRNLTAGEVVGQVMIARPSTGGAAARERLNVVFMGMGEPLANCPSLFKAIRILNDPGGAAVGARRMTVSTAGLPPGIKRLRSLGLQVGLAISLNAATDELRSRLMPINKRYPIRQLLDAAAGYASTAGRRVTLEYVMLGGVNDRRRDAAALAALAADLPCKINIISYNPSAGARFKAPTPGALARFVEHLYERAPAVTVRKSKGADIDAACGQLATAAPARRRAGLRESGRAQRAGRVQAGSSDRRSRGGSSERRGLKRERETARDRR
jgi:23S rRNA (adenine2503-C2)-methyltransferase